MVAQLIDMLETTAIVVSGFLIKKYVFLEPDMEGGRQRKFYLFSFLVISVVFLLFGKDAASLTAIFLIGLNICLGRRMHRLWGLPLLLPLTGTGLSPLWG